MGKLSWAVALTTVPERRESLLPRTLESLRLAGWSREEIRLCVDGEQDPRMYGMLGYELTLRYPRLHGRPGETNGGNVCGNWVLALYEMWIRHPEAHRYMIVQDDVSFVNHLRTYLDAAPYPEQGYLNLYADRWTDRVIRGQPSPSWVRGQCLRNVDLSDNQQQVGKHKGFQMGRGALALVFDREAVRTLLSWRNTVNKFQDPVNGWHRVDGMIVTTMNECGYSEWVHNPSLCQHHGEQSTCGNLPTPGATTFPGQQFDARTWLK